MSFPRTVSFLATAVIVAARLVVACGGGSSNLVAGDGGSQDGATIDAISEGGALGDGETYTPLRLNNNLCLPEPLRTAGAMAACRVLLSDGDAGCAATGLSLAASSDVQAIDSIRQGAGGPPLQGALCELVQTAGGATGSGCADQQVPGWCYVSGSCVPTSTCAQDLCVSSAFASEAVPYDFAWLACP